MKQIVLDSYALISYLEREPGADEVSRIFDECVSHDEPALLCIVNWGEVYYHALRVGNEQAALLVLDTIKALPIELVEADRELTLQAAWYKAYNKMSYADAFAAGLAKLRKAELVTGDREFKEIEKDVKIRWIK